VLACGEPGRLTGGSNDDPATLTDLDDEDRGEPDLVADLGRDTQAGDAGGSDSGDAGGGDDLAPDLRPDRATDAPRDTRDGGGSDADDADDGGADVEVDADTRRDEPDLAASCPGVVCGDPAVCCDVDQECVGGACLPACESGVRCGDDRTICCGEEQICLVDACSDLGGGCLDSFDCDEGWFCEPLVGRCVEQPPVVSCQIVPAFDDISTEVEWSYTDDQVISIPIVADLDGDNSPEVVLNLTQLDGESWPGGAIQVLEGTGEPLYRIAHAPAEGSYGSHGRSTIAAGDVSGDALPDIIYATRPGSSGSHIAAVDGPTGDLLWLAWASDPETPVTVVVENGAVTLANLDDDAPAEVILGVMVIDDDGRVLWNPGGTGPRAGSNAGYTGGISAVADLTGDGQPEIVSGGQAWALTWDDSGAAPALTLTALWPSAYTDGYPAVADLDGDGSPEVVLVASGAVRVIEGATGALWCGRGAGACDADAGLRTQAARLPFVEDRDNRGGPPTIADFDGDGRPEIGVAGGWYYTVFDAARPGEALVRPDGDPEPAPGALYVRWRQRTRDLSSNATGSSVFDFQGDGAAEVVYADECYMRVFSGESGAVQLEIPSSSGTIHEYPLIVDVDGDNNSEILIVANDSNATSNCAGIADYEPRRGLYVYGDPGDSWVRTRRVWPQHTYHVSNATSRGNVPVVEEDNWTTPGLNNYRQNVQGEGVFNAPDLRLDLSVSFACKGDPGYELVAVVTNAGSLGARPGTEVRFYEGSDAGGALLGTVAVVEGLLPGASTTIRLGVDDRAITTSYYAEVDSAGVLLECVEDNNAAGIGSVPPCL
jgi:hypothetical protein